MRNDSSFDRREFLGVAAMASAGWAAEFGRGHAGGRASASPLSASPVKPDSLDDNIYTQMLGVRPHLPAHDHISRLGGGHMSPEVLAAMARANDYYVDLAELNDAAGKHAAELLGAEAAMITCGGFSALMLGDGRMPHRNGQGQGGSAPPAHMASRGVPDPDLATLRVRSSLPRCRRDDRRS